MILLSQQPCGDQESLLPLRAFPLCAPLDKTPTEFTRTPLFWFESTNAALPGNLKSSPCKDPSKSIYFRFLLLSLVHSALTYFLIQPLEACHALSPGSESNKFSILISLVIYCWTVAHRLAPCAPMNRY